MVAMVILNAALAVLVLATLGCGPRPAVQPGPRRIAVVRTPEQGRVIGPGQPVGQETPEAAAGQDAKRAAASRLVERAQVALAEGRLAPGVDLLERAVAVDPTWAEAYLQLAQVHLAEGDYELAVAFLDKAEQLSAGDVKSLGEIVSLRGEVFEALGRGKNARQAYEQALSLAPNNTRARAGLRRLRAEGMAGD
jgi:tetratricopeptide (TPR) repeat protein